MGADGTGVATSEDRRYRRFLRGRSYLRRCDDCDVFKGLFDLLLQLILKDEVDIYEVTLTGSSTVPCPRSSSPIPGPRGGDGVPAHRGDPGGAQGLALPGTATSTSTRSWPCRAARPAVPSRRWAKTFRDAGTALSAAGPGSKPSPFPRPAGRAVHRPVPTCWRGSQWPRPAQRCDSGLPHRRPGSSWTTSRRSGSPLEALADLMSRRGGPAPSA